MKVLVNAKEVTTDSSTLLDLSKELALPDKGVAVAVNNQIVPRAEWADAPLSEGANIVIIKAACGG